MSGFELIRERFRHLETFSSLFPDHYSFIYFIVFIRFYFISLLLRTPLKRKHFNCSIEKHT